MLTFLVCPHKTGAHACRRKLVLENVFSYFNKSAKGIKEGYLKCTGCGTRYPIFFGIPILVDNFCEYLRSNLPIIMELSKKYEQINRKLIADSIFLILEQVPPKERKKLFHISKKQAQIILRKTLNSPYLVNYYGDVSSFFHTDHPLYELVNKYKDIVPYRVLEKFMGLHQTIKNDLALEIGCNLGGNLKHLSENAKFIFGLDVSFLDLFYASCMLRHVPVKIDRYGVNIHKNTSKRMTIVLEPINNLMLIAGKGDNLPFAEESLAIILSCNVFDIIGNPVGLVKEKIRVLKKGGLLLSSDPHAFSSDGWRKFKIKKDQTIWERTQQILSPRIKILEERDNIPWLIRNYDNMATVYLSHCFCGIKNK